MSNNQDSLLAQANKLAHDRLIRRLAMPIIDKVPTQGEKIDIPALPQRDELTEICQLFGKPLYVRLDWRDPEIAEYELDRISSTIKDAFRRAYGWFDHTEDKEALRDANTKAGEQ